MDTPQTEQEVDIVQGEKKEPTSGEVLCSVHCKNIQGYCSNDRQVLCIECILSGDHKNHEICAIEKAAKHERDSLTLKF